MSDLGWPLRRAERLHGDVLAFSAPYRELAARLRALDVAPGARIGVLAANTRAHAEAWLGVPAAGGVLVSLNYRLAPEELRVIVEDAQLSALITDPEHHDLARSLGCPLRDWEDLLSGPPRAPLDLAPDTLAAISYTGGTTGTPKGVMLSHGNLLANAQHNLAATGHRPTSAGCTCARCSTSPGSPTCSRARGSGRSRSCSRASMPPRCWRRSSASASPTPCSCRPCSRCCSTRPAPTPPT